jgi:type I restriction enzyme S subunit
MKEGEDERENAPETSEEIDSDKEENTLRLGPKQVDIPNSWDVSTFEEVNNPDKPIGYGVVKPGEDIDDGTRLVKIEDVVDGYLSSDQKFHQITEQKDEKYSRSRLSGGEILVSIQGTVGDAVIVPPDMGGANISRTIARLTPEQPNNLWIKYYIESKPVQDYIQIVSSGSTRASYNIGDIRKTNVALPPLSEQRKIATVLYTVDRAIEKTEELVRQTERVKSGMTQDLLKYGLNNEKMVETDSRFGLIPKSWELRPLKQVGEIAGRTAPEKDETECWGGDIPWATPSEITALVGQTIDDTEEHLTESALEKVSSNLLPPMSVLMTTRATIGECAVNTVEMTTNQGFKNVIPGEKLDTWYAYYRLDYEKDYLASLSKGSTFPEVGKDTVENFVIPVPPINEQREIGELLRSVDKQILSYKENKSQYERVKRGVMQDLLSGTVRTTDTNIQVPDEIAQHG